MEWRHHTSRHATVSNNNDPWRTTQPSPPPPRITRPTYLPVFGDIDWRSPDLYRGRQHRTPCLQPSIPGEQNLRACVRAYACVRACVCACEVSLSTYQDKKKSCLLHNKWSLSATGSHMDSISSIIPIHSDTITSTFSGSSTSSILLCVCARVCACLSVCLSVCMN